MFRSKHVVLNLLVVTALLLSVMGAPAVGAPNPSFRTKSALPSTVRPVGVQTDPNGGDDVALLPPPGAGKDKRNVKEKGEDQDLPLERAEYFYSRRTAGTDPNFTMFQATQLRAKAADETAAMQQAQANKPQQPDAFGGAWSNVGPNPMVLTSRGDATFDAMTGRTAALAVRSTPPYTLYVGGAQGGVWTLAAPYTGTFTPRTDNLSSMSIGAIALAPSNEDIVYVGTGEGALSGDSYFGNGVLKSTDGGNTFVKISASGYFTNVSFARKIAVNPNNPNVVYVGTLRGRGGSRRTSPPNFSPFGVYKSTDGGVNWTAALTVSAIPPNYFAGVTDIVMDPQNPNTLLVSILGQGISKTVDGGVTWYTAMTGLPAGNYATAPTRVALGLSRPSAVVSATVYAGFEYYSGTTHIPSMVYKSTNSGETWAATLDVGNVVRDYCGGQCFYDNVMGVDPISPTIVYAEGLYNYGTGSGGIFRSVDGGNHWVDIGWNMHPDYHSFTVRKDNPAIIFAGNDGGLWWSSTRGGRLNSGDPLTATQWSNLNGLVGPTSAATLFRSNIVLGQASSVATNPAIANRFYQGTQDNGTQRKSTANNTWFDVASGDGGQVLVDPTDANFVYGTYFNVQGQITPYRFTDGGGLYLGGFTSNEYIVTGINQNDRVDFYLPWIMDPADPNRLYLGTYRVYRTDNGKAPDSADVLWNTISGDLTSGCTGTAPNGARNCSISALGKSAGSPALYVGTLEGWVWVTKDSTADTPTWTRVASNTLPLRPVAAFAVDRSNYRWAYVAYNGFNAATPTTPGHVFKTTDGGTTWTDISGNLPDAPVNSIIQDASNPQTLYVGTDVGPFVSYTDGNNWVPLGANFPIVTIWQLALNPFTRQLVAGTHGRGVWSLTDSATQLPALQISKAQADDAPVGPGSLLTYRVTVKNYGNAAANWLTVVDPLPTNTTFVSASSGGALVNGSMVWTVPTLAAPTVVNTGGSLGVGLEPGSVSVTFTVQIANSLSSGDVITNDGMLVSSAQGVGAMGSPSYVTLAPANAVQVTPASQFDGGRIGQSVLYNVHIRNLAYNSDTYNLSLSGNSWPTEIWDATATQQITQTPTLGPGQATDVKVSVTVPVTATNGATDTVDLTVQSAGNPSVSAVAAIETEAVSYNILLVDDDLSGPNVESYYTAALNAGGFKYNTWDIASDPVLPLNFLKAHKIVVWFTGMAYPGPVLPYEGELADFLDSHGRLFISGQDVLDQSAGTTEFVHDYLHIDWDGTEGQNDVGTLTVTAVLTNPVTAGMGAIPLSFAGLPPGFVDYSDAITPIAPAIPAFTGTFKTPKPTAPNGSPTALSVDTGSYKVVFLGFPFEAMGTAVNRANLMARSIAYFLIDTPPSSVAATGPTTGLTNNAYEFTADVTPPTTTLPLAYYWQASGQSAVAHVSGLTDTVSFSWPTAGTKAITVTAGNLSAYLLGVNETPPNASTALGVTTFTYDPATRQLSYELMETGIVTPTGAHIHRGAAGVPGPIAYPLNTPTTGYSAGVVTLSASDEALMFSGGLYVNVHSIAFSGGEIRGQIGSFVSATRTITIELYKTYLPLISK